MSNSLQQASREYATRPADERFDSIEAFLAHHHDQRERSREKVSAIRDYRLVSIDDAPSADPTQIIAPYTGNGSVMLEHKQKAVPIAFTHWAYGQLCRALGANAQAMRELPPHLASAALNAYINGSADGTKINILARLGNGSPAVIRACTSETYGRLWDETLYSALLRTFSADKRWTLPPTWDKNPDGTPKRGGAYAGDRDSFLCLISGGSIVTDPTLRAGSSTSNTPGSGGEMYRGLLVRNSEVGACSVSIDVVLYRAICGNHILWGAAFDRRYRRRHVGQVTPQTLREIHTLAWNFTEQSAARDQEIIRQLAEHRIADTPEALQSELRTIGFSKSDAAALYPIAQQQESQSDPLSYWAISNAATRLSQASSSGHEDDRYSLDQLAAAVLARGRKLVAA